MIRRIRRAIVAALAGLGLLAGPALAHNFAGGPGSSIAGFPKTIYARTPGGTTTGTAQVDVRRWTINGTNYYAYKVTALTDTFADGPNYCVIVMFKHQSGGVPSFFRRCTGTGFHDLTDRQAVAVNTGVDVAVCQQYLNPNGTRDAYNCSQTFWWGPDGGYTDGLTDSGIANSTNEHWL